MLAAVRKIGLELTNAYSTLLCGLAVHNVHQLGLRNVWLGGSLSPYPLHDIRSSAASQAHVKLLVW